jgi:hypothetical protein
MLKRWNEEPPDLGIPPLSRCAVLVLLGRQRRERLATSPSNSATKLRGRDEGAGRDDKAAAGRMAAVHQLDCA